MPRKRNETIQALDRMVGIMLRARRKRMGLSMKTVGEVLGVTGQQIQKFEMGTSSISAAQLHLLSLHLGTTIDFFYMPFYSERVWMEIEEGSALSDK